MSYGVYTNPYMVDTTDYSLLYNSGAATSANTNTYQDTSIFGGNRNTGNTTFTGQTQQTQQVQEVERAPQNLGDQIFGTNKCTDGKNDGKVGFFGAIGGFFKGIGKAVVNTVVGIVTDPKKLLMTAGAVALAIVCPPAGVAMAVAGGISAVGTIGKGIGAAMSAKTDAEAKDAWENIGAGGLQLGLSALGAKAGLKAMRSTPGSAMEALSKSGTKGFLKSPIKNGKAFFQDAVTGGKGSLLGDSWFSASTMKQAWTGGTEAGMPGYALTRGVNNVAENWRNSGEVGIKRVFDTASKTKTQVGEKLSKAKTTRQANKEVKKLNDAQKRVDNAKTSEAKVRAEAELNKLKEAYSKRTSDTAAAVNKADKALQRAQRDPAVKPEQIKQLEQNLKNATEAHTQQIDNALRRTGAQNDYTSYQQRLTNADDALKAAIKNDLKLTGKELSKAISDARDALNKVKYNAPQTGMVSQGLHASNEQAILAGYGKAGSTNLRPLLTASTPALANSLDIQEYNQFDPNVQPTADYTGTGTGYTPPSIDWNAFYNQNMTAYV